MKIEEHFKIQIFPILRSRTLHEASLENILFCIERNKIYVYGDHRPGEQFIRHKLSITDLLILSEFFEECSRSSVAQANLAHQAMTSVYLRVWFPWHETTHLFPQMGCQSIQEYSQANAATHLCSWMLFRGEASRP